MRNFSGAVLAALQNATGERVFLIAMDFSSATLYFSTGSRDLLWNSQVWTAVGGNLALGTIEESGDAKGPGIDLQLSGVDPAITAILLAQEYRGRTVEVWQAFLNRTTGEVIEAVQIFAGLQLDNYEVEERQQRGRPGTVTVRTRARHRLSTDELRGIRANVHGHQFYYPGDTFFSHVASIAGQKIFWGTTAPNTPNTGDPSNPGDGGYYEPDPEGLG